MSDTETFTIVRHDIPLDAGEYVIPDAGGHVVKVAPEPDLATLTLTVWVVAGVWSGDSLAVRVVRDNEPVELSLDWGHVGSTHDGALHVLCRRIRTAPD